METEIWAVLQSLVSHYLNTVQIIELLKSGSGKLIALNLPPVIHHRQITATVNCGNNLSHEQFIA